MNTDLQLMLYGKDLQGAQVRVLEEGLSVKAIHPAESPNYLFIDMSVTKAGKYTLEVKKGRTKIKVPYEIRSRRAGSQQREGITQSDAIYLIMPDRFANGDTDNDVIKGSTQLLDRSAMDARHGGDIQGIMNHLDYMADLGVTALWPTPLLEDNQFYHHYAISDYYTIDPHFGTNELYKEMVGLAHSKGIKMIQDIVPNHCGSGYWWMKDLPFKDWVTQFDTFTQSNYALYSFSDPHASEDDRRLCSTGWFVESLPDMNLANPYVLHYLIQMAVWWIEYADLDALRVDTYFYMGREGALWTEAIRKEYPAMKFVGEVWGNDPGVIAYWLGDKEKKDGFATHLPMAMDFPLQRSLVMGLASDNEAWGGSTKAIYHTLAQDFLYDNPEESLVIFPDNHDMSRIYNMLGRDIRKVKMAMTLVATMRGIPQIYYGTELLFADDVRGGAHQSRMDFPGGWRTDTLNLFHAEERTSLQQEMFNHTRKLLQFRKQMPVAYAGKLMHYVPKENVYTYFRYNDAECVMVILNGSSQPQQIEWARFEERLSGKKKGTDILTGEEINKGEAVKVDACGSMVIYFR
jgi:glycosidase